MENRDEQYENRFRERAAAIHRKHAFGRGRIWTGVFLLLIGVAALTKSFLIPVLPEWLFTWQMLLILLGLFIGIRHNFRGGVWFMLMLLGGIFLLNEFYPGLIERRYIWPMALIVAGLFLIFKPRRKDWSWQEHEPATDPSELSHSTTTSPNQPENLLDSTSIFGGIKKTIFSKNFQGGEIVNILGGAEINLSQADIQGVVTLELTQIFGGTMLIVPPHWDVKPEMAAILGGIDDKRPVQNVTIDPTKVLLLKGTSIFGGIEIKSF